MLYLLKYKYKIKVKQNTIKENCDETVRSID